MTLTCRRLRSSYTKFLARRRLDLPSTLKEAVADFLRRAQALPLIPRWPFLPQSHRWQDGPDGGGEVSEVSSWRSASDRGHLRQRKMARRSTDRRARGSSEDELLAQLRMT